MATNRRTVENVKRVRVYEWNGTLHLCALRNERCIWAFSSYVDMADPDLLHDSLAQILSGGDPRQWGDGKENPEEFQVEMECREGPTLIMELAVFSDRLMRAGKKEFGEAWDE